MVVVNQIPEVKNNGATIIFDGEGQPPISPPDYLINNEPVLIDMVQNNPGDAV